MSGARDEFYVGYLPLPAGDRRALRLIVPALLWLMVVVSALVVVSQRSPGDAVWEDGKTITIEGVLVERPYPMVELGASTPPVFLVEQGKHGAQARASGIDGKRVRVTGWRLARDGREILELAPEASAITIVPGSAQRGSGAAARLERNDVVLSGEIVDYKCYLGAMKPGDGKTHKACATLCVSNGIPPVLVSARENGGLEYTVLADEQGRAAGGSVLPLVGEPVRVRGALSTVGGLRVLRVAPGGVERADGR